MHNINFQVEKAIEEKQDWVDKHLGLVSSTALHADLPVTASQVLSEKSTFEALVNPIMNKPKPKPKVSYMPLLHYNVTCGILTSQILCGYVELWGSE